MKVLIVDDNRINNFICENIIKQLLPTVDIECYENGVLVESILIEQSSDILFVLLDLNMPLVDGWDLLNKLQKNNIELFVVVLTSSINNEDKEKAMKFQNVKDFISKPATFNKLNEIILAATVGRDV